MIARMNMKASVPEATEPRSLGGKPRLGRREWLNAALSMLVDEGLSSISILQLAKRLGVTRGGFYHHFRNRDDLLAELLNYWEKRWTLDLRDDVAALQLQPREELLALMRLIRHRGGSQYDVVFRSWALKDATARSVVRRVDEARLGHIIGLFEAMGFEGYDARNRARLFLYYEMAEPAVLCEQSAEEEEALLVARHRLLTEV